MNSATLALPARNFFMQALLAAALACCLFSFMVPKAHAASLTEAQIQAIVNMVAAFGGDAQTVANVNAALRNTSSTPAPTSAGEQSSAFGTATPAPAVQTLVTSISPATGSSGTSVVITGSNFGSANYVNLVVDGHAYQVGYRVPSTDGGTKISFVLAVPSGTPAGTYTVQVCNGGGDAGACSSSSVTFALLSAAQAGTLTVGVDASSPSYQVASAGAHGVVLGVYQLHASGEPMKLTTLGMKLTGGNASDLNQIYVYSGSALVGTAAFNGSLTTTVTLTAPVLVPQDGTVLLTIRGDLAGIGVGQTGTPGDLIKVDPVSYQAVGQNSGTTGSGDARGSVAGVRVYRSYPSIALVPLPANGVQDGRLIRFAITADPAGAVGLAKIRIDLAASGVSVSDFKLYGFIDGSFSQPVSASPGGLLGTTPTINLNNGAGFAMTPAVEIPAGQTYYFEVRATVSSTSGGSVTARIYGNGAQPLALQSAYGYNFIWSPNDYAISGSGDADWTTAGALPSLTPTGISQTRLTAYALQSSPTGGGTPTPLPPSPTSTEGTHALPPSPTSMSQPGAASVAAAPDYIAAVAAAAAAPFDILTDVLSDLFLAVGIGR